MKITGECLHFPLECIHSVSVVSSSRECGAVLSRAILAGGSAQVRRGYTESKKLGGTSGAALVCSGGSAVRPVLSFSQYLWALVVGSLPLVEFLPYASVSGREERNGGEPSACDLKGWGSF